MTTESTAPRGTQLFEPVETGRVQAVQYDGTSEHAEQIAAWVQAADKFVQVDPDRIILIGTRNGICRLWPGEWLTLEQSYGLPRFEVVGSQVFEARYTPVRTPVGP